MVMLPDLGQHQLHTLAPLGFEIVLGGVRVVARREAHVEHFFEGVPTGFPVLQLNQVEHFVLALQHQVMEPQEYGCPLGCRTCSPLGLHRAGAPRRGDDVLS
jgi:hypothetical protein